MSDNFKDAGTIGSSAAEQTSGKQAQEPIKEMVLEDMANEFIKVANELVNRQNVGQVGRAMRLATSMFNSHEYALKSPDMEVDRGDVTEWFVNEYRSMLEYHMDLHKSMKSQEDSSSGCSSGGCS